jgi:hypothetical protein
MLNYQRVSGLSLLIPLKKPGTTGILYGYDREFLGI